jgi:hypothetical protein
MHFGFRHVGTTKMKKLPLFTQTRVFLDYALKYLPPEPLTPALKQCHYRNSGDVSSPLSLKQSNKWLPTTRTVYPTFTEPQQNIVGGNGLRLRTSWRRLTSNGQVENYSKLFSAARFSRRDRFSPGDRIVLRHFHVSGQISYVITVHCLL